MPAHHLTFGYATLVTIACGLLTGCARDTAPTYAATGGYAVEMRDDMKKAMSESGGGASVKVLAEPTGWATFRGKFSLVGQAPAMAALTVDKDVEVCKPGGRQILSEDVVIGPNGGIQNVLVYLTSDFPSGNPKWEHDDYANARNAEVIYDQKQCIFLSHVFALRSTQTLKILNSDPVGHNTNIQGGGKAIPFNQTIPANGEVLHQIGGESRAPFSVSCSIHPWMSARMISRDSPLFAVSNEEGEFTIANVPAGVDLTFRVWQERSKYVESVTVNGESKNWSKGQVAVTLEPDEILDYDVKVDASVFQ